MEERDRGAYLSHEEASLRALRMVRDYSPEQRRNIASDFYVRVSHPDGVERPCGLIFFKDSIDIACERLLNLARMNSDYYPTPSQEQLELEVRLRILAVQLGGEDEFARYDAVQFIAESVAGDDEAEAIYYEDEARDYPMNTEDWEARLMAQFGGAQLSLARSVHGELFDILRKTKVIATSPEVIKPVTDADIVDALYLSTLFPDTEGERTIKKIAKMRGERDLGEYRRLAYKIRGLEYSPKD